MGPVCHIQQQFTLDAFSKGNASFATIMSQPRTEFELDASKILASLCMLGNQPQPQHPPETAHRPTNKNLEPPKSSKLELPHGDKRRNMIPKVILRDIGKLIAQVSPRLYLAPKVGTPNVREKRILANPRKSKFPIVIDIREDGFRGFPEDEVERLKKSRFHVNTNILATSLDLLDLRKTDTNSASPFECCTCGVIFSSVRHCKYHQCACSMEVSNDPTKQNNVRGDGVWLCPWCPVVCFKVRFLNKHKEVCREKGRCFAMRKGYSQRKALPNGHRRRHSTALLHSNYVKPPAPPKKPNKFKVFHGHVIPVLSD